MLRILLISLFVLLAIVAWVAYSVFSFPAWVPIVATIVLLLVVIGFVFAAIISRWRKEREARQPYQAADDEQTIALRSELERATAQRGQDGLPRIVLFGPSQSGKSSLIASAGKTTRASFAGHLSEKILEGETDSATHVYALPDSILVEASRDFVESEVGSEWFKFLEVLREKSNGKPINGLALVLSVEELLQVDQAIETLANMLRDRIEDMILGLGIVFPIYVVISKMDCLSGFVDLFDRCNDGELEQEFGIKVALAGQGADPVARIVRQRLQELQARVDARIFAEVEDVADVHVKTNLINFSRQMTRLQKPIARLIGELFPDHGEPEAPIFRGLFFTSTTLYRSPSSSPLKASQGGYEFGLVPAAETSTPYHPRLFFLQNLFTDAFRKDNWIAYADPTTTAGRRFRRILLSSGLILFALGSMVFPWLSMASNRALVLRARHGVTVAHEGVPTPDASKPWIQVGDLEPLYQVVKELETYEVEGVPFRMRLGMYQGSELVGPVSEQYIRMVREHVVRPVVEDDIRGLESLLRSNSSLRRSPTHEDYWQMIDRLRRILLLADVPEADALSFPVHQPWIVSSAADQWAAATQEDDSDVLVAILDDYLRRVASSPGLRIEFEETRLIERTRRILERQSRGSLWLEQLQKEYADRGDDLSLDRIVNQPWLGNGGRAIPYIFTLQAWDTYLHSELECNGEEYLDNRSLLLAALVSANQSCDDAREELYDAYFRQYIVEWTAFLKAISTQTPRNDLRSTASQLDQMTSSFLDDSNPLRHLFFVVREQVSIDFPVPKEEPDTDGEPVHPSAGDEPKTPSPLRPSPVGTIFENFYSYGSLPVGEKKGSDLPIIVYLTKLNEVNVNLNNYLEEREPEDLQAAKLAADDLSDLIDTQLRERVDEVWRPTFGQILKPPLIKLSAKAVQEEAERLSNRWCQEVVEPFDLLEECYPFTDTEECNVRFTELAQLLHPVSGSLWDFYESSLKSRYPRRDDFEIRAQSSTAKYRFNPDVGTFLSKARDLGISLYPAESKEPLFEFAVIIRPAASGVREIEFSIDGDTVTYANAKEHRRAMVWPGASKDKMSSVRVVTKNARDRAEKQGPWSLFRLLEEGYVQRRHQNLIATWELKGAQGSRADVQLEVYPDSHATPFFGVKGREVKFMDLFRAKKLRPPRQLVLRGRYCVRQDRSD